ncbi:MAG TPA: CHAT domain-containing protein [Acidimicrobiales bacterium]|nr:CHAT domain-containing protein [Acidimicrobiales bacterium]
MPWSDALAKLTDLAEERLRDPEASLRGARQVLAEAAASGDTAAREVEARAWTVMALAQHYLADLPGALESFQNAIAVGTAYGLRDAEALARACLAPSLLSAGDAASALRQISMASALSSAATRGLVALYQAVVLQRSGRLGDAAPVFARAVRWLQETDNQPGLALAHSNRAVMYSYQGNLHAALESLAAAEAIERRRDLRVLLAMDTHNTGFTLQRLGRLPDALAAFDRAEDAYQALGNPHRQVAVLQADRCEAFLLAGMVAEAQAAAARAVTALEAIADQAHLMECRLLLAQALLAGGDYQSAAAEAALAARGFSEASRPPWAALAHYVEIQSQILEIQDRKPRPPEALLTRCREIAAELEAEGWPVESIHVRTFAGRVALALGRGDVARSELARAAAARTRGTADLRAKAWLAMALLRLSEGDRGGAKRALSRGIAVVGDYLASLGAAELRVNAASHGGDLARMGLRLAVQDRRAVEVLRWAERWRFGALARPAVQPPDDERLASQLSELRRVRAELRPLPLHATTADAQAGVDGGARTARLVAQAVELERSIRRQSRQSVGDAGGRRGRIDVGRLRQALGERWLVEYVASDSVLYAIAVNRHQVRLHRLEAADIEVEKRYLLFALRRLLAAPGRPGAEEALAATAARVDDMLLGPLQLPPAAPVVVVPTGALHGLPWPALPSLAGRVVTVAPSASIWLGPSDATHRPPPSPVAKSPIALIAGPQLPGADEEVARLAALYGAGPVLTGPGATAAAVSDALQRAEVAHLAAHGSFRADSPQFSSVLLADGPINVYDLERLHSVPQTMVLAACEAAVSAVGAGDGLLGTAAALISLGVRAVVAPVLPVPDRATTPFMVAVHRRLRAGDSPSRSLAAARAGQDSAVGAAFVCIGCDEGPSA